MSLPKPVEKIIARHVFFEKRFFEGNRRFWGDKPFSEEAAESEFNRFPLESFTLSPSGFPVCDRLP